jgi:hypothetical protein
MKKYRFLEKKTTDLKGLGSTLVDKRQGLQKKNENIPEWIAIVLPP